MGDLFLLIRFNSAFERILKVDSPETVIGRDAGCEICLSDPLVSRKHAMLLQTETGWRIRDLNSRNGTRLNGTRSLAEESLSHGSEVQAGSYVLQVYFCLADAIRQTGIADDSTRSEKVGNNHDDHNGARRTSLTPAQLRVYDLLVQGLIEKEVAAQLGISVHTVHDHVKAIYKTFSVSTRGELVSRWATRHG